MYSTRRENLFQSLMGGQSSPFLKLRVHRDRLIMDALVEIEVRFSLSRDGICILLPRFLQLYELDVP